MYMLSRLRLVAYGLSLAGAGAAAIAIVLIAAVILLEICLRTFFATSTFMSDELVGYLVGAICFLPLGYAFGEGGLLRVNLLLDRLKDSPRARRVVEIGCVVLTLGIIGLLIWYVYANVSRQFGRGYVSGTISGIPQWIPTGTMLIGLAIFWFQVLVYGIGLVVGGQTLIEEIADETAIG
ncbi:MAG TPA: TRAP transporter small permease [Paenirhodobacter sp.]